ncbi:MAG: hypothetical protein BGO01_00285 [Armatimonadetes bacterium 55-13]|nr:MAG: hypothetical protein BGO01_00285 [Armatimonadetes bacterium 55-13]
MKERRLDLTRGEFAAKGLLLIAKGWRRFAAPTLDEGGGRLTNPKGVASFSRISTFSPEDPNRLNPVGVEIDAAYSSQGSSQARNPSLSGVAPPGQMSFR